jgi:hypothetical protein
MTVTYDRSVVSLGTPVSSTNKTDRHYITETLLKVASKTITLNEKVFCDGYNAHLSATCGLEL